MCRLFPQLLWAMFALSFGGCADQIACRHTLRVREHPPSLPNDAPVAVYLPNDLYVWDLDMVDPPVYRGLVPGPNTGIASMGLAGETRKPSDLISEARRRAREVGCDGVVFDSDAFTVSIGHMMSAGARAIRHREGITPLHPYELSAVSRESWFGFLEAVGHEEHARPLGARELAAMTQLSMDHITDKTTGIVRNVTSEEEAMKTIRALLFRAYISGAVEVMQDRRCVETVLEELPFSYPENRLLESWQNLTEAVTPLGFPDAGPLRQCPPSDREMVGYRPPRIPRYELLLGTSLELISPIDPVRNHNKDSESPNMGHGTHASVYRRGLHGWLSLDPGVSVNYVSVSIENDNGLGLRSTSDVSLLGIGLHGRLVLSLGAQEGPDVWVAFGPEVVFVDINVRGSLGWPYTDRIEEKHSFSSVNWPIALGASSPPSNNNIIGCDIRLKVIGTSNEMRGSQLFKAERLSQVGFRVHVARRF